MIENSIHNTRNNAQSAMAMLNKSAKATSYRPVHTEQTVVVSKNHVDVKKMGGSMEFQKGQVKAMIKEQDNKNCLIF